MPEKYLKLISVQSNEVKTEEKNFYSEGQRALITMHREEAIRSSLQDV
jgi:hypothetical protein